MFKNINKMRQNCLAAICTLIIMMPFLMGFDVTRTVKIKYDGQTTRITTNLHNPGDIIKEAGIKLNEGDGWKELDGLGSVIEVVRGKSFSVSKDGAEKVYKSNGDNVGEALKRAGVSFKNKRVYPLPNAEFTADMKIHLLNSDEKLHFSEADIAAPVEYIEDYSMKFGVEKVEQEGKSGKAKVAFKVKKNDVDNAVGEELGRETIIAPVKKIVRKGMAKSVLTPEGYKSYTKKMIMESTAYTIHCGSGTGLTSIGIAPYEGIVAVDPNVIPYYTKMYIPGYGVAMAGDTGGAIVGNIVDVFMDDWNRAIQWGRRDVEVYILED